MKVVELNKNLTELEKVQQDLSIKTKEVEKVEQKIKELQNKAQREQERYQKLVTPFMESSKAFEAKMKTLHGELMIAKQAEFRADVIYNYLNPEDGLSKESKTD